jgi:hypothetical protein
MTNNMPKYRCLAVFAFFFIGWMVLSIQPAAAWTQVTLAWSPNAEPDIAGYRVFSRLEGEDYAYDEPAWEGTENTCTLDILDENSDYCFVARAFDTEGYESADSNEVCSGDAASNLKSLNQGDSKDENVLHLSYGCFIDSLLK